MDKAAIQKLGSMARIRLSDEETTQFQTEIEAILAYVSKVDALVESLPDTPSVPALHNVFRADEVTNTAGEYTDALMREMPDTKGRFMRVKKILDTEK